MGMRRVQVERRESLPLRLEDDEGLLGSADGDRVMIVKPKGVLCV